MRAPRPALVAAALWGLTLFAPLPAPAARTGAGPAPDCQQLLELYRACHRLGTQSDSARTCQDAAQEHVARAEAKTAGKNPLAARALAEVVCATGCEDASVAQPPATTQEFIEAFCDPVPAAKPQGGRP